MQMLLSHFHYDASAGGKVYHFVRDASQQQARDLAEAAAAQK
jgi:type VI protein secretion system component VasF